MDFQLSNITMPVAALLASLIGATATITATLIQLRMAWKKEMKARERGQPVTKQARRGPVVAITVLLIASAVGGFVLAQYLHTGKKNEADLLRSEFNAKLDQLNAAAERLERAGPGSGNGAGVATATVTLPPCGPCNEQPPERITLCASVPANATVSQVSRFLRRGEDAPQAAATAADATTGYSGQAQERLESDSSKLVCQDYLHGDATQALTLRIMVHYEAHP